MITLPQAISDLHDRLTLAECIGQAFNEAARDADNPPGWVHVYQRQIAAIRQAVDAVSSVSNGVDP